MPRRRLAVATLVLTAGFAAAPLDEAGAAGDRPLRIGVVTRNRGDAILDRLEPFRRRVEATLRVETRIERLPDVPRLIEALAKGRVDQAKLSASGYVTAAASCGCVEPLAVPRAADGTARFHAVVVTRAGSPIRSTPDLAGRRLAVGDSIVGRRLATVLLAGDLGGREPSPVPVSGPEAALTALLDGRAEAAMVWSTLDGDPVEGYGRGTLHDAVAAGTVAMSDLRVVWSSPELPHGPQVVRASLDDAKKRALRDLFVDLADLDPEAYEAIEPVFAGGYLRVGDAAYRPYRALLAPAATTGRAAATAPAASTPAAGVSSGSGRRSSSTPAAADR
jgi:phosphonate transport system substrate-binding protein